MRDPSILLHFIWIISQLALCSSTLFIPSDVPIQLPTYSPSYSLRYEPTQLPTYAPSYSLSYEPTFPLSYEPTYDPTIIPPSTSSSVQPAISPSSIFCADKVSANYSTLSSPDTLFSAYFIVTQILNGVTKEDVMADAQVGVNSVFYQAIQCIMTESDLPPINKLDIINITDITSSAVRSSSSSSSSSSGVGITKRHGTNSISSTPMNSILTKTSKSNTFDPSSSILTPPPLSLPLPLSLASHEDMSVQAISSSSVQIIYTISFSFPVNLAQQFITTEMQHYFHNLTSLLTNNVLNQYLLNAINYYCYNNNNINNNNSNSTNNNSTISTCVYSIITNSFTSPSYQGPFLLLVPTDINPGNIPTALPISTSNSKSSPGGAVTKMGTTEWVITSLLILLLIICIGVIIFRCLFTDGKWKLAKRDQMIDSKIRNLYLNDYQRHAELQGNDYNQYHEDSQTEYISDLNYDINIFNELNTINIHRNIHTSGTTDDHQRQTLRRHSQKPFTDNDPPHQRNSIYAKYIHDSISVDDDNDDDDDGIKSHKAHPAGEENDDFSVIEMTNPLYSKSSNKTSNNASNNTSNNNSPRMQGITTTTTSVANTFTLQQQPQIQQQQQHAQEDNHSTTSLSTHSDMTTPDMAAKAVTYDGNTNIHTQNSVDSLVDDDDDDDEANAAITTIMNQNDANSDGDGSIQYPYHDTSGSAIAAINTDTPYSTHMTLPPPPPPPSPPRSASASTGTAQRRNSLRQQRNGKPLHPLALPNHPSSHYSAPVTLLDPPGGRRSYLTATSGTAGNDYDL